ncbi:MAG TPA: hypothetical protein ACHBZA_06290 [Arsenophonus apicola]|uniref:hypothetical protein n=1 Tax=Arsenophonus TaxID=637 RepID=UPI0015D73F92|nr:MULTISPECIES: hypothetical protein [Arsenophonus]UBX29475.1 hypothetical protein LDL57_01925 [Arsenophonus apicola]
MKTLEISLYWLIFIFIDLGLALLSLQTHNIGSLYPLIWFPAGILVGFLSISPPRYWPLWLVKEFLVDLCASQLSGRSVIISLIFATTDSLYLAAAAFIWQYFYGVAYMPRNAWQILNFTLINVVVGSIGCFITNLIFYLSDLSFDLYDPLERIVVYILNYLPLSFLVIYSFCRSPQLPCRTKHWLMIFFWMAIITSLIFYPVIFIISPPYIAWLMLASVSMTILLSLSCNLLLLSAFLSLCSVGFVLLPLLNMPSFNEGDEIRRQSIIDLMQWCSVLLAFPALFLAGFLRSLYHVLFRYKARFLLAYSILELDVMHRFLLSREDEHITWYNLKTWRQYYPMPASWALFVAWIHFDDRKAVEQLKMSACSKPKVLKIRLSDGKGGFNEAHLALILRQGDRGKEMEGLLYEISR